MELRFWGTRGSIAVPGEDTLGFGGNTTCVELRTACGKLAVIDAGTGIRPLGEKLLPSQGPLRTWDHADPLEVHLLITHLHWDHINGFPFFGPLYSPQTKVRVGGWPKGLQGLAGLFTPACGDGRFPVKFRDLPADIAMDPALSPPDFRVGECRVRTHPLHHPQGAICFRFDEAGGSLAFVTDNELLPGQDPPGPLVKFLEGVDVLIHDAQYLPPEMAQRRGWGHSDWQSALELARRAGAPRLILTHHDPSRSDDQVEALIQEARYAAGGRIKVEAAFEGLELAI